MPNTTIQDLINSNITQQSSSDRINASEVRGVMHAMNSFIQDSIAYSANIPFNKIISVMPQTIITQNTTFTKNLTGAIAGCGTIVRLVGNGTATINLTNFKRTSESGTFVNTNGIVNLLTFFFDGVDCWISVQQEAGVSAPVGDTTAPTVLSRNTNSATTIRIVFSEVIPVMSLGGHSFKRNGAALVPMAVSGNGTNTADFTVPTIVAGEVLLHSYNSATGDTKDASDNELVSFTDVAVTNNVVASGTTYDSDAQLYFTAIEADDNSLAGTADWTTFKNAWNGLVVGSKADGDYASIQKAFPMIKGSVVGSLRDAIGRTNVLTQLGAGSFVAGVNGLDGGGTKYLNSGLIAGTHFGQNSLNYGIMCHTASNYTGPGFHYLFGARDSEANAFLLRTHGDDGNARAYANGRTDGFAKPANTSGIWSVEIQQETGVTTPERLRCYHNNVLQVEKGGAEGVPPTNTVYLGADNNGSPEGTPQILGGYLMLNTFQMSDARRTRIYNRFRAYLTAVGRP